MAFRRREKEISGGKECNFAEEEELIEVEEYCRILEHVKGRRRGVQNAEG